MVGLPVFLGAEHMATKAFIQVPGEARRVEANAFRQIIGQSPALHRLLLRYMLALMNLMAQSAACNRTHVVEERCARWLPHTVRAALTGLRQKGFVLTKSKDDAGTAVYRVEGGAGAAGSAAKAA